MVTLTVELMVEAVKATVVVVAEEAGMVMVAEGKEEEVGKATVVVVAEEVGKVMVAEGKEEAATVAVAETAARAERPAADSTTPAPHACNRSESPAAFHARRHASPRPAWRVSAA